MVRSAPRLLLVDNFDSFTFNLYQYLGELCGIPPMVVTHDANYADIAAMDVDGIVISPGPGSPERTKDFGICARLIREATVPLLGICLGHQGLGLAFGADIALGSEPMHGRASQIEHQGDILFTDIPQSFEAIRYHSLILTALSADLKPIAWTGDQIMGIRHVDRPMWGLQFHPESIGTTCGKQILSNFVSLVNTRSKSHRRPIPGARTMDVPDRSSEPISLELMTRTMEMWVEPDSVFSRIFAQSESAFWLDSTRTGPEGARFSYMGDSSGPLSTTLKYRISGRSLSVVDAGTAASRTTDIFTGLSEYLDRYTVRSDDTPFDFKGGLVGYLGYEVKAQSGGTETHGSPTPDAQFVFADRFVVFDHLESQVILCALLGEGYDEAQGKWLTRMTERLKRSEPVTEPRFEDLGPFHPLRSAMAYQADIETALDLIRHGESYEVCLTTQWVGAAATRPDEIYRRLRRHHDVPFGVYLRFGDLSIASVSPERFLRITRDGDVEAKPIKGTAPRGETIPEDSVLAEGLAQSTKDRAENLMIVDLLRNDLGRVCEIGTVHVPKLMDIESYAVHQMVSTIAGRLAEGNRAIDALKAAFPGGSMTGAPKVRTMEIIDELEAGPRGVYSGCIGYLSLDGAADFNIVIRTLVMTSEETRLGVGGAIVALSDPQDEWNEALLKASTVLNPLQMTLEDSD